MMTRPSDPLRWADVGGSIVEPSEGKKDVGWVAGERPTAQHSNWFLNNAGLWVQYLDNGGIGRRKIQQSWATPPTFASTSVAVGDFRVSYPAAGVAASAVPTSAYPYPSITLQVPAAADGSQVSTGINSLRWTAGLVARWEADVAMSVIGANALQVVIGVAVSIASGHFNGAVFSKIPADTNWQCLTDDGTTTTTNQTGYIATPPVAGVLQRFRIDCYGSSDPNGARALFYINDVLVCTNTSNISAGASNAAPYVFVGNATVGATAQTVRVGTVALSW